MLKKEFPLFFIVFMVPALILPRLFHFLDASMNISLDYEMSFRWYATLWMGLLIAFYFVKTILNGNLSKLLVLLLFLFLYFLLIIIFLADKFHPLMEEFSYIRYTTAFFLFSSSLMSLVIFLIYKHRRAYFRIRIFWLTLLLAFAYLGADEIFQIHERIGTFVEKNFKISHVFTDLVTLGYGFLGLIFVFLIAIPVWKRYFSSSFVLPRKLLALSVFSFVFSASLDTFDVYLVKFLQKSAAHVAINYKILLSDFWYFIYDPKVFANSLEEIFENISGFLLFSALLLITLELLRKDFLCVEWKLKVGPLFSRIFIVIPWALVAVFIADFKNIAFTDSPLAGKGGVTVEIIASAKDGLKHSDDLVWHKKYGLLLANEGRGNVINIHDGKLSILPDPDKMLTNTDAVTADDEGIYVSDPNRKIVYAFRNNKEGGFELSEFVPKDLGLKAPEGILKVGLTTFIVDEKAKGIYKFDSEKKKIEFIKPNIKHFKTPEGISFHPGLQKILISDDTTGYVFKMDFDGNADVFLTPDDGLKSPEDIFVANDGRIIISDNGVGKILIFSDAGKLIKTYVFKKVYSDLQGVTADESNNLFAVTADGFGSSSFMPSYVFSFKID